MTSPGPGGASPLRMGGFVLIGVAAVATVVGLVSLASGDHANQPAAASTSAAPSPPPLAAPPPSPPAAAAPSGAPASGIPPAPAVSPAPGAAPAPGVTPAPGAAQAPGATTAQKLPGAGLPPAAGGDGYAGERSGTGGGLGAGALGNQVVRTPVRVYNNSTIKDLAQRAAARFRAAGWEVTEVGNYPYGTIPHSTVYYRPGTEEQAAAESLASGFGMRVEPRFAGIANATPGLIVILTRDFQLR